MQDRMECLIRDKLSSEFRLIEGGTTYLLFNVNNLSLFKIDNFTYELLLKILDGDKIENILDEDGVHDFGEVCKKLFRYDNDNNNNKFVDHKPNTSRFVLDRLVLNVSNVCNLNCCYCYAKGGSYGEDESFMEENVAIRTVDYFYNRYNDINSIQFFGGEPLLNPEIIQTVCEHILDKYNKNKIQKLPVFAVVTNGTIMSSKILEILSDYKIQITVSIDGPQFIHDPLRGQGTYDKIIENIEYLKNENITIGVE